MKSVAGEFADDVCSEKCDNIILATRLCSLLLLGSLFWLTWQIVTNFLFNWKLWKKEFWNCGTLSLSKIKEYSINALKPEVDKLNIIAVKRQQELKDVDHSACNSRNLVGKCHDSLYCLQHPDDAAYTLNRNLIYKQLHQVVTGISKAAHATASDNASQHHGGGEENWHMHSTTLINKSLCIL